MLAIKKYKRPSHKYAIKSFHKDSINYSRATTDRKRTPLNSYIESELHKVCKKHPQKSDLEYILNKSSSQIRQRDIMGKLPLHVACEQGASADSIMVLINEYESACMIADADGKLPIHHLCENYVRNSNPNFSLDEVVDEFLNILECMLCSSSNSLLKVDSNGLSPLEHAIEANLDYEIVYSLRKETEKLIKKRWVDFGERNQIIWNVYV